MSNKPEPGLGRNIAQGKGKQSKQQLKQTAPPFIIHVDIVYTFIIMHKL